MGATNFDEIIIGESASKCFDILSRQAEFDYGCDAYNGSISTCDLGSCTLSFDKYLKSNEKKAYDHIKDKKYGSKWIANYVDLGVVEYELLTVKKEKKECNAKYKMKYVICELQRGCFVKTNYSFEKIKDAESKAIELALENPDIDYSVSKDYVVESGKNTNCILTIDKKVYKSKPKASLKPNQKLIEKHKYIFYGWASC